MFGLPFLEGLMCLFCLVICIILIAIISVGIVLIYEGEVIRRIIRRRLPSSSSNTHIDANTPGLINDY